MSEFWDFLRASLLGPAGSGQTAQTMDLSEFIDKYAATRLAIYQLALRSGVNLIANLLSKCEFRTFLGWKEIFGEEYYLWNYAPNRNENASFFKHRIVEQLIQRGECLVVFGASGEALIADSYVREPYALYSDTFRNVTVGGSNSYTFTRSFRSEDVLYFRLQNEQLSGLLSELEAEYAQLFNDAVTKFRKAAGEHGILSIDANMPARSFGQKDDGSPRTFNDVYREMMEKQFKSYFNSPNAVMTMWDGFSYDTKGDTAAKKSTSDVKDIADLREQVYDSVANALLIPPALLKGTVADTGQITKDLLAMAVDPWAHMIETETNRKRNGKAALRGNYIFVDTTRAQHVDVFGAAAQIDKLRGSSALSVNEIRRKIGEPKIDEPWADDYALTKNYEVVSGVPNSGTE